MLCSKFFRVGLLSAALLTTTMPAYAESLRDALANAYANNPQIASALLSVKASAEDIALRRAGKLPTISATGETNSTFTVSSGGSTSVQTTTFGLSYQQTLFDNLRTDAQIEQARALSVAASEGLRNAEQNVLLQAATAYTNVVRDTQLVQLRAENVKFFQAQVQSAQDRLQIGEGTRLDVSQADASLANSVASYRAAISALQSSQASYERWIGTKPQNLSLDYNFAGALPNSLDQALQLGESYHPAILSAKAQLRAAQSASDAARAAFGPTITLIGSIGGNFTQNSVTGSTTSASSQIRLTLSVPIYAGGAIGAGARQANINQIKGEIDALDARDQVREAVIASWSGLQNSVAQIDAADASVRASRTALEGVIEEQNVGQRTTLDVLNARSNLTTAEEGRIIAQTSRLVAAFSLISASGRLSARELSLPVQIKSASGYIQKVEDVWQELRSVSE